MMMMMIIIIIIIINMVTITTVTTQNENVTSNTKIRLKVKVPRLYTCYEDSLTPTQPPIQWVGPTTRLNVLQVTQISCLYPNANPRIVQVVV